MLLQISVLFTSDSLQLHTCWFLPIPVNRNWFSQSFIRKQNNRILRRHSQEKKFILCAEGVSSERATCTAAAEAQLQHETAIDRQKGHVVEEHFSKMSSVVLPRLDWGSNRQVCVYICGWGLGADAVRSFFWDRGWVTVQTRQWTWKNKHWLIRESRLCALWIQQRRINFTQNFRVILCFRLNSRWAS